jgi:aspartate/methionine/tyrosine aminotransferase
MPEAALGSVSEEVAQAAAKAMRDGHTHYTDRPGILPLRGQIVDALGERYGIELNADEVTITCGATEARFVALKKLVTSGQAVVSAGNGSAIRGAAVLLNLELVTDSDHLPQNAALLYLTPADGLATIQKLLNQANQHDLWLLWDDSGISSDEYGHFHPAQNPELAARTISIGDFEDSLPGWRVGWMAGSQAANKLRAYKQTMTICTTSISQWAALGLANSSNQREVS